MKRLVCWLLICALLLPGLAAAEEWPPWEYPLPPEVLQNTQGYITLANRDSLLDAGYTPEDLVTVTARRASGSGQMQLRRQANEAINAMFAAAQDAGYTLYVKSAYRSYQTQKTMYNNRLEKLGRDDGLVSYPGASDHQTGLGVDILNYAWTQKDGMNKDFANASEAQWLAAHCQEFGFVLRYMDDKEEITGIKFEPWHFRYVGTEAAVYIMENHLSLEEFTQEWQAYIAAYEAKGGDFGALLRKRAEINLTVIEVTEDGEEEISIFY